MIIDPQLFEDLKNRFIAYETWILNGYGDPPEYRPLEYDKLIAQDQEACFLYRQALLYLIKTLDDESSILRLLLNSSAEWSRLRRNNSPV